MGPRVAGNVTIRSPAEIPSTDFAVVHSSSIAVCAADRVTWWAYTAFLTAFSTESLL